MIDELPTVSLTYKQLAERRSISVKSAKLLVARKRREARKDGGEGWPTAPGNDGEVRIQVPASFVPDLPVQAPAEGAAQPPTPDAERMVELMAKLASVEASLEAERRRSSELVELRISDLDAAEARRGADLSSAEARHQSDIAALRDLLASQLSTVEADRDRWAAHVERLTTSRPGFVARLLGRAA